MAVSEQTPYKEYTANGSANSFALEFDCENQDHLIVLVDDVEPVVGTWSLIGGAVVFSTVPANGKKITIQRNTPFKRDGDFQSYDNSFRPGSVNKGFDKIWWKIQELGVADWLLGLKLQKFRDDVNLTALEDTLEQAQEIRNETAELAVEVQGNVDQSQTLLVNTTTQANLAQGSANSAGVANAAAQQAAIDVSTAKVDVYSALSEQQVEVNNSLTAIAGGHKAYQTLVAAQTAQVSLPINTIVEVTNDGVNNGSYQWNGTTLTKSAYDPLVQAKNYTDEEVSSLGISSANNPSISVAIVDDEDNRTWLEADGEGKPTDYSASLFLEKIDPSIDVKVQDGLLEAGIEQINSPEVSVAIVDDEDNRTWLEADGEGKPTQYAAECIIEAINFNDVAIPSKFKSSYQPKETQITSGPDIVCWGDSMTAGAGGNGTTYPSALKTLLQSAGSAANTYNMGVGGETSVTICARQGGNPFIITINGGIIPADISPVTVTLEQIDGQTVRPLLQGVGSFTGYLGDTHGTLNLVEPSGSSPSWQADNYYTFARTTAGSEITLNRPTPFYIDVATPRLGDIHIIWVGQNGPNSARAISDAKAMIQRMQALDKRFLVISKPTTTDADDSLFFAEFGRRFVAARKYLVQYGLQDAGITPTSQDTTDIANGTVPTSLRIDGVHWNAQGYTVLANVVFKRLKEMGWI